MKPSPLHALAVLTVMSLSACYTWQPPAPDARGASLNKPAGNRYMDAPAGDGTQYYDPAPVQPQNTGIPNNGGYQDPQSQNTPGGTYTPPQPGGDPAAVQTPRQPPANNPSVTPEQPPPTQPQTNTPPKAGETPYGIKIPGRPGYVLSPFDKTAGQVDVTGMAPGTKVKCPYTGKVFKVP